jgi:hypothetical protein
MNGPLKAFLFSALTLMIAAGGASLHADDDPALFTIQTYKINGQIVGWTPQRGPVVVVCRNGNWLKQWFTKPSAEMVFPDARKFEIDTKELDAHNVSMIADAPIRRLPLDRAAVDAICSGEFNQFDLEIRDRQVKLLGTARAVMADTWDGIVQSY